MRTAITASLQTIISGAFTLGISPVESWDEFTACTAIILVVFLWMAASLYFFDAGKYDNVPSWSMFIKEYMAVNQWPLKTTAAIAVTFIWFCMMQAWFPQFRTLL